MFNDSFTQRYQDAIRNVGGPIVGPRQQQQRNLREQFNVEVFTDSDPVIVPRQQRGGVAGNGMDALGSLMDQVAVSRTTWKPCMLPDDFVRSRQEKEEDEEDGIGEHYDCELCSVTDGGLTSNGSEVFRRICEIDDVYYRSINDDKISEMMANQFNEKIHDRIKAGNSGIRVPKMSKPKMRYHRTRCDKKNLLKVVWRDVEFVEMQQNFIRHNGMFKRKVEPGDEEDTQNGGCDPEVPTLEGMVMDSGNGKTWRELSDHKLKLVKFLHMMERETEKKRELNMNKKGSMAKAGSRDFSSL
jgi:hypothetical protein